MEQAGPPQNNEILGLAFFQFGFKHCKVLFKILDSTGLAEQNQ